MDVSYQPIPCECLVLITCYLLFIVPNFCLDRGFPIILKDPTNGVCLLRWSFHCEF